MRAWLPLLLLGCSTDDRPPGGSPVPVSPVAPVLRRLTTSQYQNALRDLFGPTLVLPTRLEPDASSDGFLSIGSARSTVSARGVELYEDAARLVADQVVQAPLRDTWIGCAPGSTFDETCARDALEWLAWRAWRRPVSPDELSTLVGVAQQATDTLGDRDLGLSYGVQAVFQAPSFLYVEEVGQDSPDEQRPLTDYELATRLSLFLWNSVPDEDLLRAAERGELTDNATLYGHVRRLIDSPRSRAGVREFFNQLLHLYELDALSKDPTLFPHMSDQVGPSAREETLLGIEYLVATGADFRELFTTRRTFVDRTLAALYALPAPREEGFGEVFLPEDQPRRGLLGQVSVLALHAHPVSTSPTLRGKFVRENLLCQTIPLPPAGVDTSIPEPSGTAPTLRDRVAEHLLDPTCSTCHLLTDPIGLALENFDSIGRFRTEENGHPIDASGDLDGTSYKNAEGLATTLAEHPDLAPCLTQNLWAYGQARPETGAEGDQLAALTEHFVNSGHDFRELLLAVALAEGFRTVAPVEESP